MHFCVRYRLGQVVSESAEVMAVVMTVAPGNQGASSDPTVLGVMTFVEGSRCCEKHSQKLQVFMIYYDKTDSLGHFVYVVTKFSLTSQLTVPDNGSSAPHCIDPLWKAI